MGSTVSPTSYRAGRLSRVRKLLPPVLVMRVRSLLRTLQHAGFEPGGLGHHLVVPRRLKRQFDIHLLIVGMI